MEGDYSMCDEKDVQMDQYDRTAITCDSGHVGRDYQYEETVDVSEHEFDSPSKDEED